jgi:diguanylate cyclase (GGDEF)-like protein
VRLRRFLLAVATYAVCVPLLLLAHVLGLAALAPVLATIGAIVALNVVLYVLLRTELNLRLADPSLTWPQIFGATAIVMCALFVLDRERGIALILCPILLTFGMFRFTRRQFMSAAALVLAGYALVIALLLAVKPDTVNLQVELFRWAVLAGVLPCFSVAGGKISELRQRLHRSNEDLGSALATIERLATHDTLTGLPNRAVFTDNLTRSLARAERHAWPVALFCMDLDRFKNINDTLGHAMGDRALQEVARRLAGCVRGSDMAARLGGDEFVLLVEEYGDAETLVEIAERILATIYQPMVVDGKELNVSVSVGVCTYPADAGDAQTLLSNADIAMYRAKEQGRNSFGFYSPRINSHSVEKLALETGLRYAAERAELRVQYQPKIDVANGRIVGVEALLRWQHPKLGLLRPDRFIPLAEETGLIVPIGLWTLRAACTAARSWRDQGLPMQVAVNLSARQFHFGHLLRDVAGVLEATGLDAGALELEITESTVMQNPEQAVVLMDGLRRLGVRLAMDDFGIGYSSIGHLKRFPVDSLKLDRTFVRDLPRDSDDVAITRAIIAMAHALDISVVAEGVERREQLDLLRSEGCDQFQGYLCRAPLEEAELIRFVRQTAAHWGWSPRARPARQPVPARSRGDLRLAGGTAVASTGGTD